MTEPADESKNVASNVEQFEEQQVQKDDDRVFLTLQVSLAFFHHEIKRSLL